jgi:phosphoesterase RecJ-like protein
MSNDVSAITRGIAESQRILVAGHIGPDPDTIGSACALGLALKKLDRKVGVYFEDEWPWNLDFLPGRDLLVDKESEPKEWDLLIVVDVADLKRVSPTLQKSYQNGSIKKLMILDHHLSSKPIGDYNLIQPQISSTGELVYYVIKSLQSEFSSLQLDTDIAICIYTAILTDTGSFQFSNTTAETMIVAADCIRYGVKPGELAFHLMRRKRPSRLKLMKEAIERLEYHLNGRVALFVLPSEVFEETGGDENDADGFAGSFIGLEGVEVVIYLRQVKGEKVKLSTRSREHNMSEFCASLGGGGHARAAGATLSHNLEESKNRVLEKCRELLT